jgi:hypothetical protein
MSVPGHIRKVIRKRLRARDRYHARHMGRQAKREARLIRGLRRRLLSWTAPKTQFDSVSVGEIPTDARAVAVYINGLYENVAAVKSRCPHAILTTISVNSADLADVLDVEAGDATNADCAGWYTRFKAARPHSKPIFYTSASNVAALVAALKDAGIKRRSYILWGAHYTDERHICGPRTCGYPKVDATQFTTTGERLDVSKCRPSYWRR